MRSQGSVRKVGRCWWIRFNVHGKRIEENSRSERRDDALTLLKVRIGEVAKGAPAEQIGRLRFEDAGSAVKANYIVKERRTAGHVDTRLKRLTAFFGKRTLLASITGDRVDKYIAQRKSEDAANATINRELALLKRMYTLAMKDGKLFVRPRIEMLPEHNARQGFFEPADIDRLIEHLPAHLQGLVRFMALTGWRKGEALSREWRHVDLDAGTIRLEPGETKNRAGRVVAFDDEDCLPALRDLLVEQRDSRDRLRVAGTMTPFVFHRPNGDAIGDFYSEWDTACTKAGVPGRLIHDLRRTAVRNLVRAGVPESVAMKITGHKTRSVFDRYDITSEEDTRGAGQRLHSYWQQRPSGKKVGKSA